MLRIASLLLLVIFALVGCGGSSSETPSTANFSYTTDLTSQSTNLKTMNGGTKVAGWNLLTGNTTINGSAATVEMLGNVDYTNGSGDFFGFVTVTLADASTLTMRMTGTAVKNPTTTDTALESDLKVIGGTGVYNNATGTGHFTGNRSTALGGVVHIELQASVQ